MKWTISNRTLFVSIYVILAIGFTILHFSRNEKFSTVSGTISVKGHSSVGTNLSPSRIKQIRVSTNGLDLLFRKKDTALVTDDGIRHPLSIIRWEKGTDSVQIHFSKGASISIMVDAQSSNISIVPEIPSTIPPTKSLVFTLRSEDNAELVIHPKLAETLNLITKDKNYLATLPKDSSWNPGNHRLSLAVLERANPILEFVDSPQVDKLGALEWYTPKVRFPHNMAMITEQTNG